jgi:hypothetical protein
MLIGAVGAFVGIVGLAFAGGWIVGVRATSALAPTVSPSFIEVPVLGAGAQTALMPDVRGLDEDTALQVVADSGISVADITVSTRSYAGATGVVVEQFPAFGVAHPVSIALVISTPAVVPDAIGRTASDVVSDLAALGAGTTRVGKYDPNSAVGTVLAISPAAGTDLPESVELTVSVAPATIYLARVSPSTSGCSTGEVTFKGNIYSEGITCRTSISDRTMSWLLSAAVDRISGTIGIADDGDTNASATAQLILDGTVVGDYTLNWGEAHSIDVPASGALKLTIVTKMVSGKADVVFGDVLLTGSPSPMSKLVMR